MAAGLVTGGRQKGIMYTFCTQIEDERQLLVE